MIAGVKQDDPQFKLRLPPELKARLELSAKASRNTLTAEIVSRLQDSFESRPPGTGEFAVQLSNERKQTADVLGLLATTLARMLLRAVDLFTQEQKQLASQIGVFEAFARGVLRGSGAEIVQRLEMLNAKPAQVEVVARGKKQMVQIHEFPPEAARKAGVAQSGDKVILVGNIGLEPVEDVPFDQSKKQTNKGPARSPNAKKPKPQ